MEMDYSKAASSQRAHLLTNRVTTVMEGRASVTMFLDVGVEERSKRGFQSFASRPLLSLLLISNRNSIQIGFKKNKF